MLMPSPWAGVLIGALLLGVFGFFGVVIFREMLEKFQD